MASVSVRDHRGAGAPLDLHQPVRASSRDGAGALRSLRPELAALFEEQPRWAVPALLTRAAIGSRYAFAVLLLRGQPSGPQSAEAVRATFAAGQLEDVHRRALVLHCVAGLTVPELAGALGVSAPAAMGVLHRARQLLGDVLPAGWSR
jgi:hypothetical protein